MTSTAETARATTLAPAASAAEAPAGFWQHFHTPRLVAGHFVTGRQVVFGGLLVFCLTPWASPPVALAKIGLTVTLFFIGAGLSAKTVRAVGAKPYLLGVLLWVVISSVSLHVILRAV